MSLRHARIRLQQVLAALLVWPFLAAPAPLQVGDALPPVIGKTLSDKLLELPRAAAGKSAGIVFSFSKTAGSDAKLWNEGGAVPGFTVIVLESVPKLFRGMAISGIRSGMPATLQDRAVILLKDEDLWKSRRGVHDADRAYVVVLGPNGRIRWMNAAPFSAATSAGFKNAIRDAK